MALLGRVVRLKMDRNPRIKEGGNSVCAHFVTVGKKIRLVRLRNPSHLIHADKFNKLVLGCEEAECLYV